MVKTANIRTIKDKLSAFLRDVQHGDIILVSDRGRVVAEIRPPTHGNQVLSAADQVLMQLAEQGLIRRGLPNTPDAYLQSPLKLAAEVIDRGLAESRGER